MVREHARAFAEQAMRRDVELLPQVSLTPRYFRVVWNGTTVAYVRPRKTEVLAEFRLSIEHWAYGWGVSRDSVYGIGLKIDGQIPFGVATRLLDDAIREARPSPG